MACDNVVGYNDGPFSTPPGGTRPDATTEPVARGGDAAGAEPSGGWRAHWHVLAAFVAAGLWADVPPANAEVVTATYVIGTPTNAVAGVVASPATLSQGAPTPFVVKFRATAALSGTGASSVTITSSAALATAPSTVALIDDSDTACFQGGTNGGLVGTTTLTVDLASSCNVAAGDEVEVDFTASGRPRSVTSPWR